MSGLFNFCILNRRASCILDMSGFSIKLFLSLYGHFPSLYKAGCCFHIRFFFFVITAADVGL
jgi:hypothetical protein